MSAPRGVWRKRGPVHSFLCSLSHRAASWRDICTPSFTAPSATTANGGSSPSVRRWGGDEARCGSRASQINARWNITRP